jgi:hypothetical protein
MDESARQKLAALNDQLSILSQILQSQFAPAVVWAGKALITAFQVGKGASGWWGARTANFSAGDAGKAVGLAAIPIIGPLLSQGFVRKKLKEGDAMGLDKEAANARDGALKELDGLLSKIGAVAPFIESTIAIGKEKERESAKDAKRKTGPSASDSLVAVGNFLGSSQSATYRIAERQLQTLTLIERNTRKQESGSNAFPL